MSGGGSAAAAEGATDPRPLFLTRSEDERTVAYRGPLHSFSPPEGQKLRVVQRAAASFLHNTTVGRHQFSDDGTVVACHDLDAHTLSFFDTRTGEAVGTAVAPGHKFQVFGLSPHGRFVVTWHRYDTAAQAENLLAWDVLSGECIGRFVQKKLEADTWPTIRWSGPGDRIASRLQTNQVVFYDMPVGAAEGGESAEPAPGFSRPAWKVHAKGLTMYELCPRAKAGAGPFHIATFSPEVRGSTARLCIFNSASPSEPVNQRGLFNAHNAQLSFSPSGQSLLALVSTVEDKSGAFYYGTSSGCLLSVNPVTGTDATLDGPTHALEWSPTADIFLSITGDMPKTKIQLNDSRANIIEDLGVEARNTVIWNSQGNFVCVAGFGSLPGRMDFYHVEAPPGKGARAVSIKLIKSAQARESPTTWQWSPSGRELMLATLFPRMQASSFGKTLTTMLQRA